VPGNFHISTHSSHEQPSDPDLSYEINAVTFGDSAVHVRFTPLSHLHCSLSFLPQIIQFLFWSVLILTQLLYDY